MAKPGERFDMTDGICSIGDCAKPVFVKARGWCAAHYAKWRKYGDPLTQRYGLPTPTCTIDDCDRPGNAGWGWCEKHYRRYQRHGDPLATSRIVGDDEKRFWSYVDKAGSIPEKRPELGRCWLWTGALNPDGYGTFAVTWMPTSSAHRWSYWHHIGPIPQGLEIDHLCRVRCCVNPVHLEAVLHVENVLRGESFAAVNAGKTHCPAGHPYDEENTRVQASGGRLCKTCQREYDERRRSVA